MQEPLPTFRGLLPDHPAAGPRTSRFTVLFVCTANVCRSPMAHALARHLLPKSRQPLLFRSAGVQAVAGHRTDPTAVAVLAERGIHAEPRAAQRLTAERVGQADLVLTAERRHRAGVLDLDPAALPRSFTLRELARILAAVETGELEQAIARDGPQAAVALASRRRSAGTAGADDISDPIGQAIDAFRDCADTMTAALNVILPVLAPPIA